ncbi:hypothetical protein TCAL_12607 [Tigriopus californicus]|uniref:Uncharacterized protein n=1 Tax=Tigriopus californicus TaxID=6832 RepID=A0A553PPN7_TIGCA|nr:uncharacterized protein LOC131882433 [Tigriopus californicus]TRY79645.1 hypothetical protein TCAL_12607 [Tigriopus californicus]|eukprot:TCALIF_12607-PA protein Name:"Protein of unknown function" AED:0.04 eAED:0.04 QI:392/1/1/1/1/1/6/241/555
MAKLQYPPQGGEKRLCLTLFCTMMLSVLSAVAIIYSIVIVYIPSLDVLGSTLQGPKMCTTLELKGNLSGDEECDGWWSCEEWCLSKSGKSCSHVKAAVRELGTTVYWDGCNFNETGDGFIDHVCNTLEDIKPMNCKLYGYEKDSEGNPGLKDKCIQFNDNVISCMSGICKNVSLVYDCTYTSKLDELIEQNDGRGYCNCAMCNNKHFGPNVTKAKYPGECLPEVALCYGPDADRLNDTMKKMCSKVGCFNCRDICHEREECFDMDSRKDPTIIGTDEYGNSVLVYYECRNGYCSEIYDLVCERRCDSRMFSTLLKNSMLFIGERVIMAECSKRSTVNVSSLDEGDTRSETLMIACTNVTIDREARTMISQDCVNGTWFEDNFNGGSTNYSYLTEAYSEMRELDENKVDGISYEEDITIYNSSKMKINIEGCVNTLAKECMAFHHNYGKDGRNYTARAVYPCFYDPFDSNFVVVNFDPDHTLVLLIMFVTIPFGIMILSCSYMCGCSRFIHVADDGHMRLRCCGKYVTGIGNVPKWDPPPPRKSLMKNGPEDDPNL